jgi:AAA+ ATPase superfamily predicted ATPase
MNLIEVYGSTYKIEDPAEAIQAQNLYREISRKQSIANVLDKEIKDLHQELRSILYKGKYDYV